MLQFLIMLRLLLIILASLLKEMCVMLIDML